MSETVEFPNGIPNDVPVSGDRIIFSKTSASWAIKDADVKDLPVSEPAAAAISAVQANLDAHEADLANPHSVTKAQVGLGNVDNTSDLNKPVSTPHAAALASKVDKVSGKWLSTEDYTTSEKSKLAGIEPGAQVNQIISLLAGAGISVTGTYPNFTITNVSPDVPVSLTAGTNVTITGTYPNFTISSTGGGGGGGGTWGTITGTLSSQTDLQLALDAKVSANAAITGATKTKITYDAKGLVVSGDDANATDIVFTPSGTVSSMNVWAAIVELDTEKVAKVSATDNAVTRFDGTSGAVQNSSVTIDDAANVAGANEIHFVLSPTASAYSEGTLRWNTTDKCLDIEVGNNSTLQVGQEMFIRVRNATGSTIANGSLCYINGATGNRPTVALAKADAEATAHTLIGMATDNIANASDGFITVMGSVHDLDTSAFTDGQEVFLSAATAGAFTATAPSSPNFVVKVGVIARAHATQGQVLIQTQVRTVSASNVRWTLSVGNGGTGLSALGTALQQLRVNAGATALEYFTPSSSGLAWNTAVNGATGTGLSLSMDNSYAASGIGQSIVMWNTQTNAVTGLSIDTGTSSVGQIGLKFSIRNASASARWIVIDAWNIWTWVGIEFTNTLASWFKWLNWWTIQGSGNAYGIYQSTISNGSSGSGYGIYQNQVATSATSGNTGYWLYQGIVNNATGSIGYWIYQNIISRSSSGTAVWWYVNNLWDVSSAWNTAKFFSLNATNSWAMIARTSNTAEIFVSRTNTATTGIVADSYDLSNIRRTSVQNGAGWTLTSAGSVLKLENVATQTAGTLTDSVHVLNITQSANSTGAGIYLSTAGTGKTALKLDTGFTTATAPTGASTYVIVDIGGTSYRILAQAA